MAPLSDTLRGGGQDEMLEWGESIGSSRRLCAPERKVRDYTHLPGGYQRSETCTDDPFGRTHKTISDRFIVTNNAFGVGVGWTRFFRSVDMQKPTLIPAFAIPCANRIR